MDWLPNLLKHLAVSRSAIVAAFVTSAILYFGPRFEPSYVDPVPKEWSFAVVGVFVFSGCLLILWFVRAASTAVSFRWKETVALLASSKLNQQEVDLLHSMGAYPSEPLNLDRIDYEHAPLSRLEIIQLVHELEKKRLVSYNQFSAGNLIHLTALGRKRALEIQRASKSTAA